MGQNVFNYSTKVGKDQNNVWCAVQCFIQCMSFSFEWRNSIHLVPLMCFGVFWFLIIILPLLFVIFESLFLPLLGSVWIRRTLCVWHTHSHSWPVNCQFWPLSQSAKKGLSDSPQAELQKIVVPPYTCFRPLWRMFRVNRESELSNHAFVFDF